MKPVQRFHQLVFHKFENEAQFHFFTIKLKKTGNSKRIRVFFSKKKTKRMKLTWKRMLFLQWKSWLINWDISMERRLCWEVTCSDDEHRLAVGRCRSTTFEGNFFRWKKQKKRRPGRGGGQGEEGGPVVSMSFRVCVFRLWPCTCCFVSFIRLPAEGDSSPLRLRDEDVRRQSRRTAAALAPPSIRLDHQPLSPGRFGSSPTYGQRNKVEEPWSFFFPTKNKEPMKMLQNTYAHVHTRKSWWLQMRFPFFFLSFLFSPIPKKRSGYGELFKLGQGGGSFVPIDPSIEFQMKTKKIKIKIGHFNSYMYERLKSKGWWPSTISLFSPSSLEIFLFWRVRRVKRPKFKVTVVMRLLRAQTSRKERTFSFKILTTQQTGPSVHFAPLLFVWLVRRTNCFACVCPYQVNLMMTQLFFKFIRSSSFSLNCFVVILRTVPTDYAHEYTNSSDYTTTPSDHDDATGWNYYSGGRTHVVIARSEIPMSAVQSWPTIGFLTISLWPIEK